MRYGDEEWKRLLPSERPSFYDLARGDLIEVELDGYDIGRDPRKVPREVLAKYYEALPGGAGNGRVVRASALIAAAAARRR